MIPEDSLTIFYENAEWICAYLRFTLGNKNLTGENPSAAVMAAEVASSLLSIRAGVLRLAERVHMVWDIAKQVVFVRLEELLYESILI